MLVHRASSTDLCATQARDSRHCRSRLLVVLCRHEQPRLTASERRAMRRTLSVTSSPRRAMSKSRPGHAVNVNAAGENDDIQMEVTANNVPPPPETPKTKSKAQQNTQPFTIMGLKPSPELVSISMGKVNCCAPSCLHPYCTGQLCALPSAVYFVQGILGLARLAISFFYKDEFHLDPATVGMHGSLHQIAVHMLTFQ